MNHRLTYLGLIGYLLIGAAAVLVPSVMPFITDDYRAMGLTLAAIGLIFPVRAAGGILGTLLSGIGSDVIGGQRLVWLAALALAAALGMAAVAQPWLLFLAGFVLVSAAQGALSTGINAMIADANRAARGRALNVLHGVYGAGAAISPLVIGSLIELGLSWRGALGGVGLIWLGYGVVAYLLSRSEPQKEARGAVQTLDWGMLRSGPFLALFLIAFIYNGVAFSLLGWIALFMQQTAGFSAFLSVSMISVFYVALTVGRFLCAAFSERIGYARTLLILAVGISLTYPLVVVGNSWLVVIGTFFTGLSLSGLFPTALAYGSRLYPEQTGTLTGLLSVAMTLGAMVPPLWTGVFADLWSFQTALGVNYLLVLPLVVIGIYLGRREDSSSSPISSSFS